MHKMAQASVFISGMTGLGVEIGNKYIHSTCTLHACMHCRCTCACTCIYTCMYNNYVSSAAKNIILAGVKVIITLSFLILYLYNHIHCVHACTCTCIVCVSVLRCCVCDVGGGSP